MAKLAIAGLDLAPNIDEFEACTLKDCRYLHPAKKIEENPDALRKLRPYSTSFYGHDGKFIEAETQ